jgi:hypothetical protein
VANIARGGCAFAGSGEADNKTKLNWIIGNAEDVIVVVAALAASAAG